MFGGEQNECGQWARMNVSDERGTKCAKDGVKDCMGGK